LWNEAGQLLSSRDDPIEAVGIQRRNFNSIAGIGLGLYGGRRCRNRGRAADRDYERFLCGTGWPLSSAANAMSSSLQMQNPFDFVGGLGLHEHCGVRVGHDFLGEGSVKMRTPVRHTTVSLVFSRGASGEPATPIIEWNGVRIATCSLRSGVDFSAPVR
jgi:hypothetical protein